MAINGTATVLGQVQTVMRSNSDEYATPKMLANNFQLASAQLQNLLMGSILMYERGRPVPPQYSEATSDIRLLLAPFYKTIQFTYNSGTQTYNADMSELLAQDLQVTKWISHKRNNKSIDFQTIDNLDLFLDSQINFPTNSQPYGAYLSETEIKVYPTNETGTVVEAYTILGEKPITVSFIPGTRNIDPDPTNTTPTKWTQRAYDTLVYMILQLFGIESSQPALFTLATQMKNSQSI